MVASFWRQKYIQYMKRTSALLMNMLIVTKKSYLEVKMTENWPIWNHDLPASCDMVGDLTAINETMNLSVLQ